MVNTVSVSGLNASLLLEGAPDRICRVLQRLDRGQRTSRCIFRKLRYRDWQLYQRAVSAKLCSLLNMVTASSVKGLTQLWLGFLPIIDLAPYSQQASKLGPTTGEKQMQAVL
ncbi:hypothetical protein AC578_8215 [Pseudocercospora eumusae]|uniref:Uncharacterized protein n=1 Tax=Pseudocercospora eumusae TaxID=321146 RepID=A0A139GUG6_9PEZI|nr:hypothetical protein AC578_8215 [Pseudocercospora eumusae]